MHRRTPWWVGLSLIGMLVSVASAQLYTDMAGSPELRMVEKLVAKGVFEVPQDRQFRPADRITRLEFALSLARAVGLKEADDRLLPDYRDLGEIPREARGLLAALANSGTVDRLRAVRRYQTLEVILETPKGTYGPGEPIPLKLLVRNVGGRAVELEFPTAQTYDFVVRRQDGAEVARWSLGRSFSTQGIRMRVEPNQQITLGETPGWNQVDQNDRPVPPGRYELIGVVTARTNPMSATVFFTKGFITAYPDNTFRPRAPLSRAEMAELVARAAGLDQEALSKRGNPIEASDAGEVRPEHRGYVALALERRILRPVEGRVRPNDPATRLDAAVALDAVMNLLGRYNFVRGRLHTIQGGSPMILQIADGSSIRSFRVAPLVAVYRNDRPAELRDLRAGDEVALLLLGEVGDVTYIEAKGP
ncbi:MAG: S-layer homology domain-containing protein [Armatimonadetes bacterium]|nr:S-layer homology domain-containing protein [Armatimonadota bacterium]MDW8153724.1 S-layer homology domain-containing protein [Armatimonadota bacterium]